MINTENGKVPVGALTSIAQGPNPGGSGTGSGDAGLGTGHPPSDPSQPSFPRVRPATGTGTPPTPRCPTVDQDEHKTTSFQREERRAMTNALLAGLTGLRANQNYLDVIGNNLANSNTPGYKSSRVTFSDILSQTLRPASGPTGRLGGTNPLQLGRGSAISSIDQNFAQGSLLTTGRTLDLGVQGNGFFVLSDGNEQFFSRVGAFGLDSQEYLVDLRSGLKVQSSQGGDIQVTLNSVVPPKETSKINFRGNLPAPGPNSGPTIEKLETLPFQSAASAQVSSGAEPRRAFRSSTAISWSSRSISAPPRRSRSRTRSSSRMASQPRRRREVAAAINSQLAGATASVGPGNTVRDQHELRGNQVAHPDLRRAAGARHPDRLWAVGDDLRQRRPRVHDRRRACASTPRAAIRAARGGRRSRGRWRASSSATHRPLKRLLPPAHSAEGSSVAV